MDADELPLTGFLGPGTSFRGDLVFEGRLRIDGAFEGRIYSEGLLELGPAACVRGEADVAEARVAGRMDGTLRVRGSLVVEETGLLKGEVVVARIRVARGASIEARVTRQAEPFKTRGRTPPG